MALRNCLGVDIGTQSVRVAQMEMGKSGPRVVSLSHASLEFEPSQTEAQRFQIIGQKIAELVKSDKLRTRSAVFCVPGQSVFVRRVKLPRSTPERMERMIRFEARQQIPFPLDKTIMEYQIFDDEATDEANVLLVAIKREFILNFMKMIAKSGLKAVAISVSSIALYNFHELNTATSPLLERVQPTSTKKAGKEDKKKDKEKAKKKSKLLGKGKKAKDEEPPEEAEPEEAHDELLDLDENAPLDAMGFEEIQAYVNLGASLYDLAIPKPGADRMIGFTRSVPLGGNEMDRAIRDKLGLESLTEARQIKETQSTVLSTDFEIEGDADKINMPASEAVTSIADRLIAELRRSLDFYISQPDGVAVDSIVLSGGLSSLPYLASYVEEKMGVPVSLAEVRNKEIRLPDKAPDALAPFAVALGLGAQGLGLAQNVINFLPEEVKNIRSLQSRKLEVAIMAVMMLAIIGLSWDIGQGRIRAYRNQGRTYENIIRETIGQSQRIQTAKTQHQNVQNIYDKLAEAGGNRDFWLEFMLDVLRVKPPEVLLDEIIMRRDGNVLISGVSPTRSSITDFLQALQAMSAGMAPATEENPAGTLPVQFLKAPPINPQSDPRFREGVYPFEATLKTFVRLGRYRELGAQPEEPVVETPAVRRRQQAPGRRGRPGQLPRNRLGPFN